MYRFMKQDLVILFVLNYGRPAAPQAEPSRVGRGAG